MTCIVGAVDTSLGEVYIGGDSAGVANWSLTVRADSKVFRNGEFIFGFTTSFRMGQLLRYKLVPPTPDGDLACFMSTKFIDAVRDCLKTGGWAEKDKEREAGGAFLCGVRGHLFSIQSDYQVAESKDNYDACGCGDEIALGSFFSTSKLEPRQRCILALRAAQQHCAAVRAPFHIVRSG
jgi:hypothetical protein